MLGKALTGKYDLESSIIECLDAKMINGVYFDIIRSESMDKGLVAFDKFHYILVLYHWSA